jgi:hypothetical protein
MDVELRPLTIPMQRSTHWAQGGVLASRRARAPRKRGYGLLHGCKGSFRNPPPVGA